LSKQKTDAPAPDDAVADLQEHGFEAAQQAVDVARFILAGEPSEEELAAVAAQATLAPASDTVQKPAAE